MKQILLIITLLVSSWSAMAEKPTGASVLALSQEFSSTSFKCFYHAKIYKEMNQDSCPETARLSKEVAIAYRMAADSLTPTEVEQISIYLADGADNMENTIKLMEGKD